jgi:hypothetical protein
VEKIVEHEKTFGKKTTHPTRETTCVVKKGKNQLHDYSRGKCTKRGHRKKNFRGKGGRHNQGEKFDLHYVCCGKNGILKYCNCEVYSTYN